MTSGHSVLLQVLQAQQRFMPHKRMLQTAHDCYLVINKVWLFVLMMKFMLKTMTV